MKTIKMLPIYPTGVPPENWKGKVCWLVSAGEDVNPAFSVFASSIKDGHIPCYEISRNEHEVRVRFEDETGGLHIPVAHWDAL